jgi:hypothetical protein
MAIPVNYGTIVGSMGAPGTYSVSGGTGGIGIDLTSSGYPEFANKGSISGGAGGAAYPGNIDYDSPSLGGNGGTGVQLGSPTVFTNVTGATIYGGTAAGDSYPEGAPPTGGTGVVVLGGSLVNEGQITGGNGGRYGFSGSAVHLVSGTVINDGTVTGGTGDTINFVGPAAIAVDSGTVINNGTVQGVGDQGVFLNSGTFVNQGLVTSQNAAETNTVSVVDGTFINNGTVSGGLNIGGSGTLVVDPGAIFSGGSAVYNDATSQATLELSGMQTSAGTAITLSDDGYFVNFATLDFTAGAQWTVSVDAQTYAGPVAGRDGIGHSPVTVEGFAPGNTIDVAGQTPSQTGTDFGGVPFVSLFPLGNGEYGFAGGKDDSFEVAGDRTANLNFSGNYTGDLFIFSPDGSGGTDITLAAAPCYCRGTRIRTTRGECPVEELRIGDLVLTASGKARPVRWLGSRGLDCTRHPDPAAVWPVRIQAGAFADEMPIRDLWVSPGHSLLVDGVLIQAQRLVNGASIAQMPIDRVQYWHVELDSHDIVLAEGLPAESYLDTGNRTAFTNGGAFSEAYPDFEPKYWAQTCIPLVLEGPAIHRAREALLARAVGLGHKLTQDADVHLLADGRRIDTVDLSEKRIAFTLPAATSNIELRCRSFIPAHVQSMSDDQRLLGLCVSRLQIDGEDIALNYEASFAQGWHALEGDAHHWRWCHSRVPLPAGVRLIVIDLEGPGFYWTTQAAYQEKAAASIATGCQGGLRDR